MALGERSQPAVVWTVQESGGMGLEMRARREAVCVVLMALCLTNVPGFVCCSPAVQSLGKLFNPSELCCY